MGFKNYLEAIGVVRALIIGVVIGLVVGGVATYNLRPNTTAAPQEQVLLQQSVVSQTSLPSLEEQKERIINYMLNNMVSPGTSIEIEKITEDREGLYKLEITQTFEGRSWKYVAFATTDGEILFPSALNMSSLSASATPILPSTPQPTQPAQLQTPPPSLSPAPTPPQLPGAKWGKTFGGSEEDQAFSVQQTSDGGYIVAGYTLSFGAGGADVYLIKTDSEGNESWSKTFGGAEADGGYSVQQTTDGGYIIAGYTESFGAGNKDVYLIKTDSQGSEVWSRTFGGADVDLANAVQQTTDGGYILAGVTVSFSSDQFGDVYLIKTDSEGSEEWSRTFGGGDYDIATSVQQTSDNGYIVGGNTESFGTDTRKAYLIKTDNEGNEVWSKTYGETERDRAQSVQQTRDGGYIMAGSSQAVPVIEIFDVYLVKTDGEGAEVWSKTYGGSESDRADSVQQTSDGGYIIGGRTAFESGDYDVYLIKTDGDGDEVWSRTFGGANLDRANSLQQTADGGYIVAGFTSSFGAGSKDVFLIKVDA